MARAERDARAYRYLRPDSKWESAKARARANPHLVAALVLLAFIAILLAAAAALR